MKKLIYSILTMVLLMVVMTACKEDIAELGAPPKQEDAAFAFTPSTTSNNILEFTSPSSAFLKKWDFGNGQTGEGNTVTVSYPFAGTYEVSLTVYTSGGSIATSQTVVIDETDINLLDPVYELITGGVDYPNGKTWIIAAGTAGHMGIGPIEGDGPSWWAAPANDKSGTGLYDDKHIFKLSGFEFIQETNGDVYVNGAQAPNFPGSYENKGDYTAPFTDLTNQKWSLAKNPAGRYILNISGGAFIGYYTGFSSYEIISISETEMFIKSADAAVAANAWFMRLIPEGFEPPPPPPPATSTLPLNFEGEKPPFTGFGESSYDVVDNPSATGLNTSPKVAQYVKGTEANWAGISTVLATKLDFSSNTLIKYKVYSPVTGRALFKLETVDGSAAPVEVFADVTKVNEWEELTFDFSTAPTNTFDKIALFLDFDNNNGGTFYVDDITQAAVPAVLTLADLTGGSSKTWKLKPAAGSFGVGPTPGSDAYWPNGSDISGNRPCLFNDEFIFKTGNEYQYDTKGDIWGEGYMGLSDGCTDESNLPTDAQPWGSGTHSFSFTPAVDETPATITVTGTGAFIALPKAYNGGEYAAAPPDTNASVTYKVLNYVRTATTETLTISLDITGDGSQFWNFTLISE
ncbi:MAG TPA: PKD domain-containing protein [Ohtaekwangia sp.]|nr:PKD domain-containing protein [Ohtaekwangia sp.]